MSGNCNLQHGEGTQLCQQTIITFSNIKERDYEADSARREQSVSENLCGQELLLTLPLFWSLIVSQVWEFSTSLYLKSTHGVKYLRHTWSARDSQSSVSLRQFVRGKLQG